MIEHDSKMRRTPRWSEETRLRAIDASAFWDGQVNRSDLIRRFGISVPQATNDLREYQRRAPDNLRYNTRRKTYLATPEFKPLFGPPDAEAWLSAAVGGSAVSVPVGIAPLPARRIDPWLLRKLLAAHRGRRALRVLYQPMDKPEPSWRWILPRALGSDGLRWHLRAWNYDADRHEDLLFPRMVAVDGEREAGDVPPDLDWDRFAAVHLRPRPHLSPGQRRVIEADYGMEGGKSVVEVRVALLSLFVRRLGLDRGDGFVEIANKSEIDLLLREIATRFT